MRKTSLGCAALFLMSVVACGGADRGASAKSPEATTSAPGSGAPGASSGAGAAEGSSGAAMSDASPAPASPSAAVAAESSSAPVAAARAESRRPLPQAGQLTAGIWDDNRNFDFWKPYAATFREHNGNDFAMFDPQELTTARDRANGPQSARTELDVQLVLDTTGSMGDELSYLQSELDSIAQKVRTRFPNVTPRWSLVVYRDKGDDYVTRQFDFTSDTNKFRRDLRAQSAGGGGDTPEAVVEGLRMGLRQSWRTQGNVAKLAFWVADAPAHPGEGKVLADVVRGLQQKGVHVYPIASSDADEAAEYQMRSTAQLTGGRYVFLTNDSGIGNDHAEPHIPCYNVTRLDSAIVRSIETELTGRHVEPESTEVIRSVGKPNKEGSCTLSSGALVAAF